jgi:CHAD domain-containing protein
MLAAFEQLAGRTAGRRVPAIYEALQNNHRQETSWLHDADAFGPVEKHLRKTTQQIAGLKLQSAGWAAIEPGLKKSFRRARQAYECARHEPSPENFHEWRKQVKQLGIQLRTLGPKWPAAAQARLKALDRVGDLLGEDHDLCLLNHWVAELPVGEEAKVVTRRLGSRQQALRATVLALGRDIFAETPKVVCSRLGKYWKRWRGELRPV